MNSAERWNEFRKAGLLWFVNRLLHCFGWAICIEVDSDGTLIDVYPDRVKCRGFKRSDEEEGYRRVAQYMADNGEALVEETKE